MHVPEVFPNQQPVAQMLNFRQRQANESAMSPGPMGYSVATTSQPSDLSMIAASANEIANTNMDHGGAMLGFDMPPNAFYTQGHPMQAGHPHHDPSTEGGMVAGSPGQPSQEDLEFARMTFQHRPIAAHPNTTATNFVHEYGDSTRVQKPKTRAKFTPTARAKVQRVRREGACVRCRMLRKNVSSSTLFLGAYHLMTT